MSNPQTTAPVDKKIIWPLQSLNFFMADLQAGVGPFLGIFLLAHGWKSGLIGISGLIGKQIWNKWINWKSRFWDQLK